MTLPSQKSLRRIEARQKTDARPRPSSLSSALNSDTDQIRQRLETEIVRIKRRMPILSPVKVVWLPGEKASINGKQLEELVVGDEVRIYSADSSRVVELLAHGCAEWLLNLHSQPYRLMVNKLIEVFEEIQYSQKERIADAIAGVLIIRCEE